MLGSQELPGKMTFLCLSLISEANLTDDPELGNRK